MISYLYELGDQLLDFLVPKNRGVISAVVVVVVAVADSAVFWHFRWPGGLWRPLLGLSEHAQPRR